MCRVSAMLGHFRFHLFLDYDKGANHDGAIHRGLQNDPLPSQHTSACVSIHQHTTAYVSILTYAHAMLT